MDGREPDGDLTEFRPWSHFETTSERDWRPVVAGVVALLVVGGFWLLWRPSSAAPSSIEPIPVVATSVPLPVDTDPESTTLPEPVSVEPAASALLSEADLMASVSGGSDVALLAIAEEAVVVHFTSEPDDADAAGYVEWARAVDVRTEEDVSTVQVRFSVVVASDPLWRLPTRTVEVRVLRNGDLWQVQGLPRLVDDPMEIGWERPELTDVPAGLRTEFEEAGWEVVGGIEGEDGWDVAVVDSTGHAVMVFAAGSGS